jgi:hypothetical protein
MSNYYERLRFLRTLSRGTEAHTHIAWLTRLESQAYTKDSLK